MNVLQPRNRDTGRPGNGGQWDTNTNEADNIELEQAILDEPALTHVPMNGHTRQLEYFYRPTRRGRLVLDQSYQRGSVWSTDRQRELMKSLLLGLPIGSFLINDRGFKTDHRDTAIVDGKQRIEAVWAFVDDEFAIPAGWVSKKYGIDEDTVEPIEYHGRTVRGVRMSAIGGHFDRFFGNFPISTLETEVATEAEEAELFLLINGGGVAQDIETMERAARIAGHE